MRRIVLAALAAILVQPVAVLLYGVADRLAFYPLEAGPIIGYGMGYVLTAVIAVAALHVLLLGVPIFLLLRRFGRLTPRNIVLAGFVAGCLPMGAVGFPLRGDMKGFSASHNWHGHFGATIEDGVTTGFGWITYVDSVVLLGLQGALGAFVFLKVWTRLAPPAREPQP
jgi:hypothetical protein